MAEAQTLTYDSNEQPEGELTAEEKDSIEVGEKLAEQQDQLLAGKFKDAEELEKGYIELQKKLGSSEEKAEEEPAETKDETVKEDELDTSFLDTLWDESQKEYSKDTLEKLSKIDSRDLAQMYLKERSERPSYQSEFTEDNISQLQGVVGGKDQYGQMMQWANDNLAKEEVQMYDAIMERGEPLSAFFAVQALAYRFNDSRGVDGKLLTGKASVGKGTTFRSQAEVVRAMNDPKYENDPAYRQDIYEKLERSNLKF
tara:strand:+ start:252 stop:1019 length:768 start_codon:yes stop_codon:yes gene_type:complete